MPNFIRARLVTGDLRHFPAGDDVEEALAAFLARRGEPYRPEGWAESTEGAIIRLDHVVEVYPVTLPEAPRHVDKPHRDHTRSG